MDIQLSPEEIEEAIEEWIRARLSRSSQWTVENVNEEEGTIRISEDKS